MEGNLIIMKNEKVSRGSFASQFYELLKMYMDGAITENDYSDLLDSLIIDKRIRKEERG